MHITNVLCVLSSCKYHFRLVVLLQCCCKYDKTLTVHTKNTVYLQSLSCFRPYHFRVYVIQPIGFRFCTRHLMCVYVPTSFCTGMLFFTLHNGDCQLSYWVDGQLGYKTIGQQTVGRQLFGRKTFGRHSWDDWATVLGDKVLRSSTQ